MWRFLRRVLLVLAGAFVLLFVFRGAMYRWAVHYEVLGQRAPITSLSLSSVPPADLDRSIEFALDTTAARLHFSTGKVSADPTILINGGPANCIGYTALCAALLRGQLNAAGLGERYTVEAVVAKLYLGDLDLHTFFSSPFWKDHDVVRIIDRSDGRVILLDPTLYDAIGIGQVEPCAARTLTTHE